MTKELLQQALNEAKADAIEVFTYKDGIAQSSRDAIEYMHSWLGVYFEKQALAQQEQCGCREGECETKKDKTCRMTIEIAERDGIPEWTPAIGIECAISSLRDDAARLRGGNYMRIQIADDLEVIANDLAKCKPDAQQEQPASVDAYNGAREDAAIWKKRALEAEELNRKFIAELNGPTYLGEPAQPAQEPFAIVPRTMILEDADLRFLHGLSQPDDEDGSFSPIALTVGDGHAGHGLYASLSEYPEEGADIICKFAPPTQPALSESQITSIAYNCNALPEVITDKTLVDFVRAIEAHCRGGANK